MEIFNIVMMVVGYLTTALVGFGLVGWGFLYLYAKALGMPD